MDQSGLTPRQTARSQGHPAMAAWLERIEESGWKRYLSGPRYELVALRELVARGRARRLRAFSQKEQLLDFLFPGNQPTKPHKRAKRGLPSLQRRPLPARRALLLGRRAGAPRTARVKAV